MKKGIFTDKKVILIGPSPYILKQKYDVNNYDYVCMVNNMFPPINEKLKEIGITRCDIIFWCNALVRKRSQELIKYKNEFKYLRMREEVYEYIPEEIRDKISYMNKQGWLKKTVDCRPNRGIRAMWDILRENPKELYITGFTFYLEEEIYYDGYAEQKTVDFHKKTKGYNSGHDQNKQINFFKKYILGRITIDEYLVNLLKL